MVWETVKLENSGGQEPRQGLWNLVRSQELEGLCPDGLEGLLSSVPGVHRAGQALSTVYKVQLWPWAESHVKI